MSANISSSSFSTAFVTLIVAASVSSVYAVGPFDSLNHSLSSLISTRNMLFALGILILGAAGYLYLSCGCSTSSLKKHKKHIKKVHNTRSGSAESSKSKSSSASQRKSPRKLKA